MQPHGSHMAAVLMWAHLPGLTLTHFQSHVIPDLSTVPMKGTREAGCAGATANPSIPMPCVHILNTDKTPALRYQHPISAPAKLALMFYGILKDAPGPGGLMAPRHAASGCHKGSTWGGGPGPCPGPPRGPLALAWTPCCEGASRRTSLQPHLTPSCLFATKAHELLCEYAIQLIRDLVCM